MRHRLVALVSLALLLAPTAASADLSPAESGTLDRGSRAGRCGARATCAHCVERAPILDVGRPPLPGEEGHGVQQCTLIHGADEWAAYCDDNVVPECPVLDEAFFVDQMIVAVAVDTLTSRPCEGSPDPLWKLECVTPRAVVRVVREEPGALCLCSAMPQRLQRLFLASAVPKTGAVRCRVCEEDRAVGCLR
ncbi:MAG: hypothetical protein GY716_04455 [bacterium]|nr:hypothetical protein [bacterium]